MFGSVSTAIGPRGLSSGRGGQDYLSVYSETRWATAALNALSFSRNLISRNVATERRRPLPLAFNE